MLTRVESARKLSRVAFACLVADVAGVLVVVFSWRNACDTPLHLWIVVGVVLSLPTGFLIDILRQQSHQ